MMILFKLSTRHTCVPIDDIASGDVKSGDSLLPRDNIETF